MNTLVKHDKNSRDEAEAKYYDEVSLNMEQGINFDNLLSVNGTLSIN